MGIRDDLIAAKKLIENPGDWGKGRRNYDRSVETCCAAEALEAVCSAPEFERRVALYAAFCSANNIAASWGDLAKWNDAPERTHADILAAFDRAIAATPSNRSK